jgi:hypothetical protein
MRQENRILKDSYYRWASPWRAATQAELTQHAGPPVRRVALLMAYRQQGVLSIFNRDLLASPPDIGIYLSQRTIFTYPRQASGAPTSAGPSLC